MTSLRWGSATDVGRVRDNNEDQLLVASPLFAVADGMGGHAAGEVASQVAVEALHAAYDDGAGTAEALAGAVEAANQAVWERANSGSDLRGMGTTLTAVALVEADADAEPGTPTEDGADAAAERFAIANVGDSRAYLLRDGELTQLTDDHSVAEEMVRSGQLNADAAALHPQRHMLTRVLGMDADVEVDIFSLDIFRGDRVLLASDGLTNEVTDDQIASTLRRLADPDDAAKELVEQARAHGGADNITVVIVDVVDDDGRARDAALANEPPPKPPEPTQATPAVTPARGMPSAAERDAQLRAMGDDTGSRAGAAGAPEIVEPPRRRVTGRVIVFLLLVLIILGVAVGAVAFYARGSYYVGFDEGEVAIFKGRPGGVLWLKPTVEQRTDITEASLTPRVQRRLEEGRVQPSLAEARSYVQRLRDDVEESQSTTTTLPPPTTAAPPPPTAVP